MAQFQQTLADKTEDPLRFVGIKNPDHRRWRSILATHRTWRRPPAADAAYDHRAWFCSEFVARLLADTSAQLDADLAAAEPGPATTAHPATLPGGFLRRVFAENERFSAAHPGHLLRLLTPFGSLEPSSQRVEELVDLGV